MLEYVINCMETEVLAADSGTIHPVEGFDTCLAVKSTVSDFSCWQAEKSLILSDI